MRKICILLLLGIPNFVIGQLSGNIAIGYNRYTNNYNDYKRTNGLTIQFGLEKKINDIFSLSYGINVSIAQEGYYKYGYSYKMDTLTGDIVWDRSHVNTYKSNNYSLSFQYPIVLKTTLINDRLFLLSGLSLNIDNFFIFGDAFSGEDPELSRPKTPLDYYLFDWPKGGIGFGQQIGILFYPIDRLGIYSDWKTTLNKSFEFSYLEVGIICRIFTNR